MFKINQMAKDFGVKAKDLLTAVEESGAGKKTSSSTFTPEEFNLFFEYVTSSAQIADMDGYLNGKYNNDFESSVKEAEKKPAKAEKTEKTEEKAETKPETKTEAAPAPEKKEEVKPAEPAKAAAPAQPKTAPAHTVPKAAEPVKRPAATAQPERRQDASFPRRTDDRFGDRRPQGDLRRPAGTQPARPAQPRTTDRFSQGTYQRPDGQKGFQQGPRGADSRFDNKGFQPGKGKDADDRFSKDKDQRGQKGKTKGYTVDRAPVKPQPKPNIETGVEKKRTGNVRVIDTRGSQVNLSKYDEKLDKYGAVETADSQSNKQKLKKQNANNRSSKKGDKEKQAMEKLSRTKEKIKKQPLKVSIPDEISVSELASRLKVTASEVIKRLMMLGVMATVNQVVDYDTAYLVADELGAIITKEVKVTIEEKLFGVEEEENEADLEPRSPVVCVMGHVDHGKTSILDAIRNSHVTDGEAGGITQAIGAYRVNVNGRDITFLDTPGHEAFTAMRARGAMATDIAILVVAADDGIMPQTVEAINHAKAAGIDIVVAMNKMDKPGANPEQIKTELTKYDLVPEEWGGSVMCVPVSAKTRQGLDDLLESVLLVADIKELKANPNKKAKGLVIESKLDKGRGPVATILVQSGTLHSGDVVIAGTAVGRVRTMTSDKGENVKDAGPSVPVEITGLSDVPTAGDEFNAVDDERMARELADQRREKAKNDEFKKNAIVNLDELFDQISSGVKDLSIIVKADVDGSAEAVKASLEKISNEEVKVKVIHSAVGGITEGDVMFAAASNALIVGFNVRPDKKAIESAEKQNVDIRTYRVIYECIEEITAAMKGMLAPKFKEVVIGQAEVRQTFRVPNIGIVGGSYVTDGKITRTASIRIVRDGIVVMDDKISSLKRFKDDAKEVMQGYECGIGLEKCTDLKEGDILEAYVMEEISE